MKDGNGSCDNDDDGGGGGTADFGDGGVSVTEGNLCTHENFPLPLPA